MDLIEYDDVVGIFQTMRDKGVVLPKLLFLNGCVTSPLGQILHEKIGIPYVIAWETAVHSRAASAVPRYFYQLLLQGKSFNDAFNGTKTILVSKKMDLHLNPTKDHSESPTLLCGKLVAFTDESVTTHSILEIEQSASVSVEISVTGGAYKKVCFKV